MNPLNIVVHFEESDKMGYPFNYPTYFESYAQFSVVCAENGARLIICRGDSYLGNMRFSAGWEFNGIELQEINTPITADLIYLKGLGQTLNISDSDLAINRPEFDGICRNKIATYQAIGKHMAPCYAIDEENWQEVLQKIATDKVVLKPVEGAGGAGIIITDTKDFQYDASQFEEPYLAQDFIDISRGIPGLVEGPHDLRLILFNGEVKLSFVRLPKDGSLLSNFAQGATAKVIPLDDLPPQTITIAQEVDAQFSMFNPRIYTIDFLFEGERAVIGEINSRPAFPHPSLLGEEFTSQFHHYLLNTFKEAIAAHNQA